MGSIFGGSKQSSSSSNRAYDTLNEAFSPVLGTTGTGANALMAMLGLGGDPAAQGQAFQNFQNSTGFDFMMDQGQRAITGSNAAKGLLRSGSTAKALTSFGQNLASTRYNDYMNQLLGLSNLGLGAGGVLAGAGNVSSSKGKSKNGLGGLIGGIASGIAAG